MTTFSDSTSMDTSELKSLSFETVSVDRKGEIVKQETRKAQYFREQLDQLIALDMVAIPSGTFMMGSPAREGDEDEHPQHEVKVASFFMGKTPITQAQWRIIASRTDLKVNRNLDPNPADFKGKHRPVEQVSWREAVEFCARLSKLTGREYRLPSEAEWEYACRAGTTTPFHFSETLTDKLANYDASFTYANEPKGQYREQTTPVASFPPNAFGLYDMHGNVSEWCLDDWHDNYKGAPTNGSAWLDDNNSQSGKILRGGSWFSNPHHCRAGFRFCYFSDRDNDTGFRVVCVSSKTS